MRTAPPAEDSQERARKLVRPTMEAGGDQRSALGMPSSNRSMANSERNVTEHWFMRPRRCAPKNARLGAETTTSSAVLSWATSRPCSGFRRPLRKPEFNSLKRTNPAASAVRIMKKKRRGTEEVSGHPADTRGALLSSTCRRVTRISSNICSSSIVGMSSGPLVTGDFRFVLRSGLRFVFHGSG
jgi:hypothetical protein